MVVQVRDSFWITLGHILTNNHVISLVATAGASIRVRLANGKTYDAKLVGRDVSYDLAVIKIKVTDAPALQLGDSDAVQVGDGVIASWLATWLNRNRHIRNN
jgi:putative serine protease PepD